MSKKLKVGIVGGVTLVLVLAVALCLSLHSKYTFYSGILGGKMLGKRSVGCTLNTV